MTWPAVLAAALAAAAGFLLPMSGTRPVLARLDPAGRSARSRLRGRLRRPRRSAAEARRAVVAELLEGLAGELRAGAEPAPALGAAAHGLAGLADVEAAAARPGGDVAGALLALGALPGGATAAGLAVSWRVCEVTGCALAAPVERLLAAHRGQEQVHREVAGQLAGPRATAHLLSALPLAGIGMGVALGADPVGFLTGTGTGLVCLAAGSALLLLGVRWTRAISASVTADWADP